MVNAIMISFSLSKKSEDFFNKLRRMGKVRYICPFYTCGRLIERESGALAAPFHTIPRALSQRFTFFDRLKETIMANAIIVSFFL